MSIFTYSNLGGGQQPHCIPLVDNTLPPLTGVVVFWFLQLKVFAKAFKTGTARFTICLIRHLAVRAGFELWLCHSEMHNKHTNKISILCCISNVDANTYALKAFMHIQVGKLEQWIASRLTSRRPCRFGKKCILHTCQLNLYLTKPFTNWTQFVGIKL